MQIFFIIMLALLMGKPMNINTNILLGISGSIRNVTI